MGEPWEFDDEGSVSPAPKPRARFAWFYDFDANAQVAIVGFALLVGGLVAVGFVALVLNWLSSVLSSERIEQMRMLGVVALVLVAIAVPILSVVAFARGMVRGDLNEAWWAWGRWFGVVVGSLTFVGSWLGAIKSWGWLLGIAFGWIPAGIVAAMAGVLAWALAPFAALILAGVGIWALAWLRSTIP